MVGTILPIVYGERKQLPKIRRGSLIAYVIGSLVGGAVLGIVVSLIGLMLRLPEIGGGIAAIPLAALVFHAVLALREVGVVNVPLPQSRWQVKRAWARDLHPKGAAFLYGLILGFGVLTRIPTGLFYALLIWVASSGDVQFGALAFLLVGLGRALPVTMLARETTDGGQMFRWSNVLHRWFPIMRLVNALVLSGAAGWFLAAELGK